MYKNSESYKGQKFCSKGSFETRKHSYSPYCNPLPLRNFLLKGNFNLQTRKHTDIESSSKKPISKPQRQLNLSKNEIKLNIKYPQSRIKYSQKPEGQKDSNDEEQQSTVKTIKKKKTVEPKLSSQCSE